MKKYTWDEFFTSINIASFLGIIAVSLVIIAFLLATRR